MNKHLAVITNGCPLFRKPRTFWATSRGKTGTRHLAGLPGVCGGSAGSAGRMVGGMVFAVWLAFPPLLWASVPAAGRQVDGLQAELTVVEGQRQASREKSQLIEVEVTVRNVGLHPLTIYQGDWSGIDDFRRPFNLYVGIYEIKGSARTFHRVFASFVDHSWNASDSQQDQKIFGHLDAGAFLKKRIQIVLPYGLREPVGSHEVAVTVVMDEELYSSAHDVPMAWVGSLTSNLVTIEVVE